MSIISISNVSKVYKLYDNPKDRFKEAIHPFHKKYGEPFYALKDISFQIEKGETVGIIGTNGSGKSTILKIITGVIQATEGTVEVNGNISALLELGAGFDLEYSGVENIYMNGSVLGYTREEMDAKKDAILQFADIGDFVYQPVKTYSSGMLVRLAFALAISVEPEILIIDEALAVGDAFFQAKCFHKLEEIKSKGTTILFVSHDILSVKKLCSRAIWIEKGILREVGNANEVCEKYMGAQIERNNEENSKLLGLMSLDENAAETIVEEQEKIFPKLPVISQNIVSGTGKAVIKSVYIRDQQGNETKLLKVYQEYKVGIVIESSEELSNVIVGFELETVKGVRVLGMNTFMKKQLIAQMSKDKVYEVVFSFKMPGLCKGEYLMTPAIAEGIQENHVVHMRLHDFETILIDNDGFNVSLLEIENEIETKEYNVDSVKFV